MNRFLGSVVLDLSQRQFNLCLPKSVPSQNVFLLLVLNGPFTSNRMLLVDFLFFWVFCLSFSFWESQFGQYSKITKGIKKKAFWKKNMYIFSKTLSHWSDINYTWDDFCILWISIFNVEHCNNVPFTFWNILPAFLFVVCLHNGRNICKNPKREQLFNGRTVVKIATFSEDTDFCLQEIYTNSLSKLWWNKKWRAQADA